jgi:hypothetical protein
MHIAHTSCALRDAIYILDYPFWGLTKHPKVFLDLSTFFYSHQASKSNRQQINMVFTHIVRDALITASLVSAYTSDNWAGGLHEDKGRISQASVDIVVPECSVGIPAYNYVPYSVSGWAGIDGSNSCNDVVLQAGKPPTQNSILK